MVKVGNVLCLSAVTVVEDNACCSLGNMADELCLAVVVCCCLCLSCAGPLAVDCVAVSVPCVYIRASPSEVVGEEEGLLLIFGRNGIGLGGLGICYRLRVCYRLRICYRLRVCYRLRISGRLGSIRIYKIGIVLAGVDRCLSCAVEGLAVNELAVHNYLAVLGLELYHIEVNLG